jgi:hypothetical protein
MQDQEFTRNAIQELADPMIEAGATFEDVNRELWAKLGFAMGRGGTGPNKKIKKCKYCLCYGGGGHGGLCPNA